MKLIGSQWLIRAGVALLAAVPGAVWAGFAAQASSPASSPVPEPGTLALVGLAVVAAMTVGGKKRK